MPRLVYRGVCRTDRAQAGKLLIETYEGTGSFSETARRWKTSRPVIPKWAPGYGAELEVGPEDQSRRPHNSPRQTPPEVEDRVMEAGGCALGIRPAMGTGDGLII